MLDEVTQQHRRELDELAGKLMAATTALESLERRVLGPEEREDAAASERVAPRGEQRRVRRRVDSRGSNGADSVQRSSRSCGNRS